MNSKKDCTKQLWVYIVITFIITFAFEFTVVYKIALDPALAKYSTIAMAACMFFPTIGMLLTRLITKEGFKDLWIKPHFKGNVKYYIVAWLLPVVAIIGGAVIYYLIFPQNFDINMGYLKEMYDQTGQPFDAKAAQTMIIMQIVTGIFLAPISNALTCLGEEWGWRGYMMPRMLEKFKFLPACIIGGIIWGLWHAPLTILGHNYGINYLGYPYLGIIAMCGFCIATGTMLTYLSMRAKSALPAVIGHAMINGFASTGIFFATSSSVTNPFIGPLCVGFVGGSLLIVVAIGCFIRYDRKKS